MKKGFSATAPAGKATKPPKQAGGVPAKKGFVASTATGKATKPGKG